MADSVNRVVAVPNWSFYDPLLTESAKKLLQTMDVTIHYCQGDQDHQRTVTAFSGPQPAVFRAISDLAGIFLPQIDLQAQKGVHPRVGALDVCPYVLVKGDEQNLIQECRAWAAKFSAHFNIPTYLYEKAAFPGREFRLPYLRGQMGAVLQEPDHGQQPNSRWGTTIVGVRDFLLAVNIDLNTKDLSIAQKIAREIRHEREKENLIFKGVRALGFRLESRNLTQLSLNMTKPDDTTFDQVYEFVARTLQDRFKTNIAGTELIGVIRPQDAKTATQLTISPEQVVA